MMAARGHEALDQALHASGVHAEGVYQVFRAIGEGGCTSIKHFQKAVDDAKGVKDVAPAGGSSGTHHWK